MTALVPGFGELSNASWHCSSCFDTVEEMLRKMASFSHESLNAPMFRNPTWIADRFREGTDLWNCPGQFYDRVDNNTDVPNFLLRNEPRFRYMLNRDGPSAGFSDFPPNASRI